MKHIILTLVAALSLYSFTTTMAKGNKSKFAVNNHANKTNQKVQMLVDFMESQFSSVTKNGGDNLALSSSTIWKGNKAAAGKWVYTEQASTENLAHPFRQNIYNVAQINDSTFLTAIYTLPEASKYTGAWQNGNLFASLNPSDLDFKKDCQVFLVFYKNNQMQLGNGTLPASEILKQGSSVSQVNSSTTPKAVAGCDGQLLDQ